MRILMTTDVVGGVWSYTEELAAMLTTRGHAVLLAALGGEPAPPHRAWLAEHPEVQFISLPYPLEWMPEPEPGLSQSVDALRRLADEFRPDVVHLNQFFYGAFDFGAPKLVVAHSDVASWWRCVKDEEPPEDAWFRRYGGWVGAGLRGADLRLAPSAWMARQIECIYGCGAVRAVHNARCPERFAASPGARAPWVVTAGRLWDEAKGARDLLPAAARLHAAGVAGRIVAAGAREHPGGGKSFPAGAPGMEWRGTLSASALRTLLGDAQVYAATSLYEPFGLAPLEAALAGCALVMSDIPTFRELWEGCALFYPAGDTDALADALLHLLRNDVRRATLADAAHTRARERFHPGRMADEYEALYQELTASGSARNGEDEVRGEVPSTKYEG